MPQNPAQILKTPAREKVVPIAPGARLSPHVVDLKPAPSAARRPRLDFEQKLSLLAHRFKSGLFPSSASGELRRLAPKRPLIQPPMPAPEARPAAKRIAATAEVRLSGPTQEEKVAALAAIMRKTEPTKPIEEKPIEERIKTAPAALLPARGFNYRHAFAFSFLALAVTLPVWLMAAYASLVRQASAVTDQTKTALSELKAAGASAAGLDPSAGQNFNRAAASFAETRSRLDGVTVALAAFVTGQNEKRADGSRLLQAGESISKAGAEISSAFDALEASSESRLPDRVRALSVALAAALPRLDDAANELDAVSAASLPAKYRPAFETARADLHSVRDDTRRFIESSDAVMGLIGAGGQRRYLVVFQNNRELRPTGGFIGSFALMDVEDGEIKKMEIPAGGSYDLRGGLNQRIAAPDQLRLVNARWEFQDANWFADFPTSAKTMAWFYEKSGGPTIDGVIAVNSALMENLLRLVGPIDLPEYGKTITADNFFDETQKAVQFEYDKTTNKPKQIISDMAPKLLKKLLDGGRKQILPLIDLVGRSLAEKDVLLYFSNEQEQSAASGFGWTGDLKPAPEADFLAVVDTNIAGGKTDGAVAEDIRHQTEVRKDGTLVDTVTVRRTHNGKKDDLFTGIKNIDYLRVYAPSGSELISADGFEAPARSYFMPPDETLKPSALLSAIEGEERTDPSSGTTIASESGLTVFGNWVQVEPGESRTVRLTYRLPYKFGDLASAPATGWEKFKASIGAYASSATMKLVVQKQPGALNRTFSTAIAAPAGWSVRARVPDDASVNNEGLSLVRPLNRDLYVGMTLSKNN